MTPALLERSVTAANEFMAATAWLDLRLYRATSDVLELAMATDLTYCHSAVLRFTDVSFYCGPLAFTIGTDSPPLHLLDAAARARHDPAFAQADGYGFTLTSDEQVEIRIAATGVELVPGTVYYYPRPDLQPSESLAYWLPGAGAGAEG